MSRLQIPLACLTTCVILLCSSQPARAQFPGYSPAKPVFSPYFNLFRRNEGPFDNYNSYYRPQEQVRRALQDQSAQVQRQSTNIRSLDQRMSLLQGPSGAIRPTGTAAGFMNYSHYFQSRRSSGPSGGRRSWSPPAARSGGYSRY
jgi:hypothetical protein